jgi:hypothetical protein
MTDAVRCGRAIAASENDNLFTGEKGGGETEKEIRVPLFFPFTLFNSPFHL